MNEAAHRYNYALRRMPSLHNMSRNRSTFEQLSIHLLLNLSRCKRKGGHYTEAIELANKVLGFNPNSFEAHYAKAKANKEAGRLHEAVNDLTEALRVAPQNRELHRVILRIKEEIAANEEKTSSSSDEDSKDIKETSEMGRVLTSLSSGVADDKTVQELEGDSTSGVDSSTGSGSFCGVGGSNERRKHEEAEFDLHSTSLVI